MTHQESSAGADMRRATEAFSVRNHPKTGGVTAVGAGRNSRCHAIFEAADDMKPLDAVDYLKEVIERLVEKDSPEVGLFPGSPLRPKEREVFACLYRREGQTLSHCRIMDYLYMGCDDEPDVKIIQLFVCKIRKKLPDAGFRIITEHSYGYRLEREPGTVFPWEAEA